MKASLLHSVQDQLQNLADSVLVAVTESGSARFTNTLLLDANRYVEIHLVLDFRTHQIQVLS